MENKKGKIALSDDLLVNVSGGNGVTIVYDYECKSCSMVWSSTGDYAVCKYCASPDIVINDQHTIYEYDGYCVCTD